MKKIILTGSTSTSAQALIELIRPMGLKILTAGRSGNHDFKVDFSKRDETTKFCEFLLKEAPDYAFIHHGVLPGQRLQTYSDELISSVLQTNLVSILQILETIQTLPLLKTVITSSISGSLGSYDTLYAASKAGLDVAIRSIAKQIPPTSRLNGIAPGIIADSKMTLARQDLKLLESKREKTPTQMLTTAMDVAKLAKYVLFESENMNGQILHLNGGLT